MSLLHASPISMVTVGVADMKLSNCAGDLLITYALGSCLGIVVYDPVVRVGGMLHVMLPTSQLDPQKAVQNPYMFVDTGVPELFRSVYRLGGEKGRLVVTVAGGAQALNQETMFRIGHRNFAMLRKLLWKNNISIHAQDVGGRLSRTISLEIASGRVMVRGPGHKVVL